MAVDVNMALNIVKARLNRLSDDTTLDAYLTARIHAAADEIEATGITLTDSAGDTLLLADYAVWAYSNRDKPQSMPDWLRLRRRERWLQEGANGFDSR